MANRMIVVSFDAMVDADMELLFSMPNFKRLMGDVSGIRHMRTIYPTVTYPAHTSIMTGCYPDKHGVVDNSELHIGMRGEMPWNWFAHVVKAEDIFTAAKRAGLTTAAVFWPVTGNHPDIDYLVDEYWPQWADDSVVEAHRRSGSSEEVLEKAVIPFLHDYVPRQHPSADDFVMHSACAILRNFKPDLLMIHPADIDGARHATGMFSPAVSARVCAVDYYLGMLAKAAEDAGVLEETNFVVMSDHGQMNIERGINLNVLLVDKGFIRLNEDGSIREWDAFVKSTGMSAQVYVQNKKREAEIGAWLRHLCDEGIYGISQVFTREEIALAEHLDGDFSFVLETDGYTSFGDSWMRPLVRGFDSSDYRAGHATHGYLPDKGPQPVFWAQGPAVRPGVVYDRRPVVDVAPTLAAMLGFDMPMADGKVMWEMVQR